MRISERIGHVADPPVAEAKSWVADRSFPPDRPLIDLSQAVPAYPPAAELRDYLADVVRRDDTAAYAPAIGLPATRVAAAARLGVADDNVMITAGCNQAFCLAIGVLCEPGDNVILPVPHYFNHDMWLRAHGIEPRPNLADADERTRAVVLVTPNNPTGVVSTPEEIAHLFDEAQSRRIALILDETYRDFRQTSEPAHRLFERDEWADTLVQLFSYSKVFALAGYRCGSLVAHPEFLRNAVKLADCHTIGAPRVAQLAVAWAIEHLDAWVADRRTEMNRKLAAVRNVIADTDFELISSGAYFAWLRHRENAPARQVARRLADEANVLCIPGECFGRGQDAFLRLAFGNATLAQVEAIADRLRR